MTETDQPAAERGAYVNPQGVRCELTLTGTGPDDDNLDAIATTLGLVRRPVSPSEAPRFLDSNFAGGLR